MVTQSKVRQSTVWCKTCRNLQRDGVLRDRLRARLCQWLRPLRLLLIGRWVELQQAVGVAQGELVEDRAVEVGAQVALHVETVVFGSRKQLSSVIQLRVIHWRWVGPHLHSDITSQSYNNTVNRGRVHLSIRLFYIVPCGPSCRPGRDQLVSPHQPPARWGGWPGP